jgi:16S rRNA (guanine966-N2)-methyltransferase
MKDRTRQALFNLLGGDLTGFLTLDLFAGTGVLGVEALSRGSSAVVAVELNRGLSAQLRTAVKELGVAGQHEVLCTDVLRSQPLLLGCVRQHPPYPWCVICCPPYQLWDSHATQLRTLLADLIVEAPVGSTFAVELPVECDPDWLPDSLSWQLRTYRPAQLALADKLAAEDPAAPPAPAD